MNWRVLDRPPILDYSVRTICHQRYPGHPRGCPNYNKRPTCPPQAPHFHEAYKAEGPFYLIWNAFDLEAHVRKMQAKHPDWSSRQLFCCLYWQGTARKALREAIAEFKEATCHQYFVTTCPEAMGVNVTETMRMAGGCSATAAAGLVLGC